MVIATTNHNPQATQGDTLHRPIRRGQAFVEFAVIALILYMLFAVTLEFGRALFVSHSLQQISDVAARELARVPLDPTMNLAQALDQKVVREEIYDDRLLVIDLNQIGDVDTYFAQLPIVNRMLRPIMTPQTLDIGGTERQLLHYPGAIVDNTGSFQDSNEATHNSPVPAGGVDSGLRIRIPTVTYDANGNETVNAESEWLEVLEGVNAGTAEDPFLVSSSWRGVVSIRVNYPFQAVTLSAYYSPPGETIPPPKTDEGQFPIVVSSGDELGPGEIGGPYRGEFGLGQQASHLQTVRPFRRILQVEATYRREVF